MLARELLTTELTETQEATRQQILASLQAAALDWIPQATGPDPNQELFAPLLQGVLFWTAGMVGLVGTFEAWELDGPSLDDVATSFRESLPFALQVVRKANGLPSEPWGRRRPTVVSDPDPLEDPEDLEADQMPNMTAEGWTEEALLEILGSDVLLKSCFDPYTYLVQLRTGLILYYDFATYTGGDWLHLDAARLTPDGEPWERGLDVRLSDIVLAIDDPSTGPTLRQGQEPPDAQTHA